MVSENPLEQIAQSRTPNRLSLCLFQQMEVAMKMFDEKYVTSLTDEDVYHIVKWCLEQLSDNLPA